jgi:hypothetical protein
LILILPRFYKQPTQVVKLLLVLGGRVKKIEDIALDFGVSQFLNLEEEYVREQRSLRYMQLDNGKCRPRENGVRHGNRSSKVLQPNEARSNGDRKSPNSGVDVK